MTRQPTFDVNDPTFQRILAEAVAARMAAEKAEAKATDTGKTDAKIINAFHKAGFKNVVLFDRSKPLASQLDCNVLTYQKWMELGRKVKTGEHSLKVRGYHLRLFHKDQTEIATTAERKAYHKRQQEAEAKRNAKAATAQPQA